MRPLAVIVLCALACSSTPRRSSNGLAPQPSPTFVPSADRDYMPHCSIYKSCPSQALPRCPAEAAAAVSEPTAKDAPYWLEAELTLAGSLCTDSSPPTECRDQCNGELSIEPGGAVTLDGHSAGIDFSCAGDDSGVCCRLPVAEPVKLRVTGERGASGSRQLIVDAVCQ